MTESLLACCRTCLTFIEAQEELMYSIYLKDEDENTISQIIFLLTGIQLDDDKSLPTKICKTCLTQVLSAKKLRDKCIETDVMFRRLYSTSNENAKENQNSDIETEMGDFQQEVMSQESSEQTFSEFIEVQVIGEIEQISDNYIQVPNQKSYLVNDENVIPTSQIDFTDIIVEEVERKSPIKYQQTLGSEYELKKHEKNLSVFICDFCGMNFKKRSYISAHLQSIHAKFKKYKCKLCIKGYHNKYNFDTHMRSHTNIKPFVCEICSKAFAAHHKLKVHRNRIHLGEKPYKCQFCDLRFSFSTDRKRHTMLLHTGERPFVCHCNKGFVKRSSLTVHQRTHQKKKGNDRINFEV